MAEQNLYDIEDFRCPDRMSLGLEQYTAFYKIYGAFF